MGAAVLLAALAPWHRSLSWVNLGLVVAVWLAVDQVRVPVAGGWAPPTMLAFVPALFLLPVALVPLLAMFVGLAGPVSDLARRRPPARTVPGAVADAWFTIGPALVLSLAGSGRPVWGWWPVYLGALLAQFAVDLAFSVGRRWIGEGIEPRSELPRLTWNWAVDLALAPMGLAIAAVAARTPALVLLVLSPLAVLWLFARERRQRLDDALSLSSAYRGMAMLLGDLVEADDHYTGMHSREVVALSVAVAEQLRLAPSQRRTVELAALLHDVGKIRIPKEIINKPGRLDDREWALVRRHPIDGEDMLRLVGGRLTGVGRVVRCSHERYDGCGYPDGLSAEEIPIEARIICACDAYSAMTTDRPYRAAMSIEEALEELRRSAGSQFDPSVVECIERLLLPATSAVDSWLELLASPAPAAAAAARLAQALEHPGSDGRRSSGPGPGQPLSTDPSPTVIGSLA